MQGKIVSHFEILDRLGSGGMGIVYKARDLKLGRTVALKFLPASLAGDEKDRQRFLREAQAASSLNHQNICTIYEIGEDVEGQPFLCMEICEGETLTTRLRRGPLPLAEALEIAIQIAAGLGQAHEAGIVHRDIKPANIMVNARNQVKILDFGLALIVGEKRLTRVGSAMGTVAYMSPEQVRGLEIDHRSDLWSLGVVLYEMLTGRLPFPGGSDPVILNAVVSQDPIPLAQAKPDLPHQLDRIVARLLEKDQAVRISSAAVLEQELRRLRPGMDSQLETDAFPLPVPNGNQRRFRLAVASLLGIAALAGLAFSTRNLWLTEGPQKPTAEANGYYLRAKGMLEDVDHPEGLDSACELFRKSVEIDPNFAAAYAGLSEALSGSSRRDRDPALLAEARSQAERALAIDPNLPEAYIALALVDRYTGRVQKSIEKLRPLVALHPDLLQAPLELSVSYEEAGNLSKAETTMLQAIKIHSDYWGFWNQLGAIRQLQGDYTGAREAYEKAIESAPSKVSWPYQNRAALEIQRGNVADAIKIYERIPHPITSPGLAGNIGLAYLSAGRLDEAEESIRQALRLQPRNARLHRLLAKVLHRRGNAEAARGEYRAAAQLIGKELEVNPWREDLQMWLALDTAAAGDCGEALPLIRRLQKSLQSNSMNSWDSARVYALCNQRTSALAAIQRAVEQGYPVADIALQEEFKTLLNEPALKKLTQTAPRTPRNG